MALRTRTWKILLVGMVVLGVVGYLARQPLRALVAYAGYRLAPDYPRNTDRTLSLEGLSKPVQVRWDVHGIPHIKAANDLDLSRAVGFVHARYRFFQMDMLRRVARGRLSEVVGRRPFLNSDTVAFDRAMRGWGFARRAARGMKTLPPNERKIVEAYSAGVNAARKRFRPWEYRLLGQEPEPWTPGDTFVLGMLNTWSISHNWQQELVRLLLAMQVGAKRSQQIYPHQPLRKGVSLPGTQAPRKLEPGIPPELLAMFPPRAYKKAARRPSLGGRSRLAADMALLGAASNAWVVAGRRSKSGKPLLANDPHLSHFLPSLLFQQHIQTPDLNAIGVTFPGVPFVLIGHNERVAWGMTAAVADAMDLVIEKPDPHHKDRVLHDKKRCTLIRDAVVIQVRKDGALQPETFVQRRTCHGPLLNDMYPHVFGKDAPWVAIRWDVTGFARQIGSFQKANRAKSVADLIQIMAKLTSPVSAIQAADVDGHIALFWAGTVPRRPHHRGTFPVPGWLDKYEWRGFLPHKAIPQGRDPKQGFFAHGNNLLVDPARAPHTYQVDSAPPYRLLRISELIRKTPKHDAQSFAAIQRDVKILRAQRVLPHILQDLKGMKAPSPLEQAAVKQLARWDFQATTDSAGTALFFATYRNAVLRAIRDELSEPGIQFFMSQRYSTNISDGWFYRTDHVVWDDRSTAATEQRAAVVRAAFRDAVASLQSQQGDVPSRWQWGKLHTLHFRHLFGGQKLLAGSVNLPQRPASGSLESVWKSHHNLGHPKTPFRTVAGPSLRMIVDMADLSKGKWIIDTGASGWPLSPHYGDQFQRWYKGEYIPILFQNNQLTPATLTGTWTLAPRRHADFAPTP